MNISKRLKYIASFVKEGMFIADIGADHGLLSYYLLSNNIVKKIYACDNKIGPFNNLLNTFKNSNFDVELSLKDGLEDLPSYVNTILIAGMGGELIIKILNHGKEKIENIDTLILSPHQDDASLRQYLVQNGFKIVDEGVVFDDKFYTVIVAKKGNQNLSEMETILGPILLKKKDPIIIDYYKYKYDEIQKVLSIDLLSEQRAMKLNDLKMYYEVAINE